MEGRRTNQYVKLTNLFGFVLTDFIQCITNLPVFFKHFAVTSRRNF